MSRDGIPRRRLLQLVGLGTLGIGAGTVFADGNQTLFEEPIRVLGREIGPPLDCDGDSLYEDVTGTGEITAQDQIALSLIQSAYQRNDTLLTEAQAAAFDFNGDSEFDKRDVAELGRQISRGTACNHNPTTSTPDEGSPTATPDEGSPTATPDGGDGSTGIGIGDDGDTGVGISDPGADTPTPTPDEGTPTPGNGTPTSTPDDGTPTSTPDGGDGSTGIGTGDDEDTGVGISTPDN